MSFTRRPGSGRPGQTSRREDHRIVRKYTRTATCFISSHPGTATYRSHSWCDVLVCHCLQYMVAPSINPWLHDITVLIRGFMTSQRYAHDILQPQELPLMQRLPGVIFQQDNTRPHTARLSQDCLCTVTTLP
ncbi:transposable element Tcb1 transposase [Trichonephila clavipes]|nr:transposable element Tcb1 transposase [Trichonephila clavipes]